VKFNAAPTNVRRPTVRYEALGFGVPLGHSRASAKASAEPAIRYIASYPMPIIPNNKCKGPRFNSEFIA
jgi:hypothetical protein